MPAIGAQESGSKIEGIGAVRGFVYSLRGRLTNWSYDYKITTGFASLPSKAPREVKKENGSS